MSAFLGPKNTAGSKDDNVLMGILRDPEKQILMVLKQLVSQKQLF